MQDKKGGVAKVAITGFSGFIGFKLFKRLLADNILVLGLGRRQLKEEKISFVFLDIESDFDIAADLYGVDVLVHCAAQVQATIAENDYPEEKFSRLNVDSTIKLVMQAKKAGVKRFVFLSSIKALGEETGSTTDKFCHNSQRAPKDYYGLSKATAERGLVDLARGSQMEYTIIRPPLVYGSGVKGNFAAMFKLSKLNLPLPFASIENKRSMVAVDNLVDLIVCCVNDPRAANQTFMVSDDNDVSTPELLRKMTIAHGKSPRLFSFPPQLLRFLAKMTGKEAIAERLLGSLQVDIEHTKSTLNWTPKVKLEDVLKDMVNDSSV